MSSPTTLLAAQASDFGLVGNGTTDDTAALRAAFGSGRTVVFDENATYSYDPRTTLVVTQGTRLLFRGAKLYERASYDRPSIKLESNTYADRLDVSIAGGSACRGVFIIGSEVTIESVRVVARSQAGGHFRQRGFSIGEQYSSISARVNVGDVYVENFDYAVGLQNAQDVTVSSITIRSSTQGVWFMNTRRADIERGNSAVLSPNAKGSAGENSVLIEATSDNGTHDIHVKNFQSYISGEHGFRIGGGYTIDRVTFDRCYSKAAGSGRAAGGCGFKVLGPTVNSSGVARHSNISFLDCIVENTHSSGSGNNFSGFHVGKSRNVRIENPVVRAAPTTSYEESDYSAWAGISIIGSENVDIIAPVIEKCTFAGIHIFDIVEPSGGPVWGSDPAGIRIQGGTIDLCGRGINIALGSRTLRRLNVIGTIFNGGEHAVYVESGIMNRCYLEFMAMSQSIGTTFGTGTMMGSLKGDFKGDVPMRSGSSFLDYSGYNVKVRTGTGWKALTYAS